MTSRKQPKSEELEESQKRFAKDIGYRTGIPPESIEKDVSELITRSQPQYSERSPPYGALSWYEKFLEIAQVRRLDVVDREFIRMNVVGSKNEYKVLSGLRFLGMIDNKCKATERLDSLRVVGDVFKERLGSIVHDAYKELFSKIVIQRATVETLVNFFMQRYDYGAGTAKQAVVIFIMLCKKAGIELNSELAERPVSVRTRRTKTIPRRITQVPKEEEHLAVVSGLTELKMDDITILFPKNDLNAALKARRLLDLYIEELKSSDVSKQ